MSQAQPQPQSAASMLEDTVRLERMSIDAGSQVAMILCRKLGNHKPALDLDLEAVFVAAQAFIVEQDMLDVLLLVLNLPPAQSPEIETQHTEIAKAWACIVAGQWFIGERMRHTGLSIPLTEPQFDEIITRCAKIMDGA